MELTECYLPAISTVPAFSFLLPVTVSVVSHQMLVGLVTTGLHNFIGGFRNTPRCGSCALINSAITTITVISGTLSVLFLENSRPPRPFSSPPATRHTDGRSPSYPDGPLMYMDNCVFMYLCQAGEGSRNRVYPFERSFG